MLLEQTRRRHRRLYTYYGKDAFWNVNAVGSEVKLFLKCTHTK